MVELEQLAKRARRANELGRLRAAVRVGAFVLPMIVVAALWGNPLWICGSVGAGLLALTVWARWHGRRAGDAADLGLAYGVLPFVGAFVVIALERTCGLGGGAFGCTALCSLLGVGAGVALGRKLGRSQHDTAQFAVAVGVSGLAAALGCVALGGGGLVGVLAAMGVSQIAGWAPSRFSRA